MRYTRVHRLSEGAAGLGWKIRLESIVTITGNDHRAEKMAALRLVYKLHDDTALWDQTNPLEL